MTETFYDLLGVAPDASVDEIETAYREAIKETHPDVSDDADAGERTKRLNEARAVLTDEDERARYDRVGHDAYVSNTAGGGPADASPSSGGSDGDGRDRARGDRSAGGDPRTETESERSGDPGVNGSGDPEANRSGDPGANRTAKSGGRRRGGERSCRSSSPGSSGSDRRDANRSRSARRQAAAGTTAGPNVKASWNGWERTRAWAVRQSSEGKRGLGLDRLFPSEQSVVLLSSAFLLYPVFVASILFPPFPIVFRLIVAACTVFLLVYLFTIPEIAFVVFGLWSALVSVAVLVVPSVSAVSVVGIVGLVAAWLPLGLAALMLLARP